MNVSDMISLIRTLGIGDISTNDNKSTEIALQFLNLAHDELYRETAPINCDIFEHDTLQNSVGIYSVTLTKIPFSIAAVFPQGFKYTLKHRSLIQFQLEKFKYQYSTSPCIYNNVGQVLSFYPYVTNAQYTFDIWYPPERTVLDLNTPEASIPYPLSYQSVLVNGALYYQFQDESGFKSSRKEDNAEKRWIEGKQDLKSYLYGANKQLLTTFRNS